MCVGIKCEQCENDRKCSEIEKVIDRSNAGLGTLKEYLTTRIVTETIRMRIPLDKRIGMEAALVSVGYRIIHAGDNYAVGEDGEMGPASFEIVAARDLI